MVKRGRRAQTLSCVIELWLHADRHRVALMDVASLVALSCCSRSLRRQLQQWSRNVAKDIAHHHQLPTNHVPIPAVLHAALHMALRDAWELVQFQYVQCTIVPSRYDHAMPPMVALQQRLQNDKVARILANRPWRIQLQRHQHTRWGVYAAEHIPNGSFIGSYTGELISSRETKRRYNIEYDRQRCNYVLTLREHVANPPQQTVDGNLLEVGFTSVRTNIDATRCGNFTRFCNHSCDGNLRVEAVRVDSYVPQLAFFTRRDVDTGEELTFDYGGGEEEKVGSVPTVEASSSVETAGDELVGTTPCWCGTAVCRGMLPFDATL